MWAGADGRGFALFHELTNEWKIDEYMQLAL